MATRNVGKECGMDTCMRPSHSRGLCGGHYQQWHRGVDLTDLEPRNPGALCSEVGCYRSCEAKGLCVKHYQRTRSNPEKNRLAALRKHGLTPDDYQNLLDEQAGRCAICGSAPDPSGKRLAVDHDHACCPGVSSCGECIRGLLCASCNNGLGRFRDRPDLLRSAAVYLEER